MQEFIISKNDSGQTVIKYMQRLLKDAPSGLIYKQIRKKNIVLNKAKITGSEKLSEGDVVSVFMSDGTIDKFRGFESHDVSLYVEAYKKLPKLQILYEDEHVIIANKPVGVLSQKSSPLDMSANEWLIGYLLENKFIEASSLTNFTPSVCNRLDRNTGGLLIFAKTLFGAVRMNDLIRQRTVKKYYKTIVCKKTENTGNLVSYLSKDETSNKVSVSDSPKEGFTKIESSYSTLYYSEKYDVSVVEVELKTGKTHQIRAQFAHVGHPVIGDIKYGSEKTNKQFREEFGLKNQYLYSYRLVFPYMEDYSELSEKTISLPIDSIIEKSL